MNSKLSKLKKRLPISADVYGKIDNRTYKILLCFICCAVYFSSYFTRYSYAALLNQIINIGLLEKTNAAAISTGAFVTYGIGQVVCGLLGDRINPRHLVSAGLIGTSLCNAAMFFMTDVSNPFVGCIIIWCLNGVFQSMLWPPLVRTMVELLDIGGYNRCVEYVLYASALGNASVYLMSGFLININLWKFSFVLGTAATVFSVVIWNVGLAVIPQTKRLYVRRIRKTAEDGASPKLGKLWFLLLLPVVIVVALQGFLRDGVATWMPSFMTEALNLTTSSSAIITAILPAVTIIGIKIAALLKKKFDNEFKCSAVLFGIATVFCAWLSFVSPEIAIVKAVFMAVVSGCMHAVNSLLISFFPARFAAVGRASTVTGVFNAFSYVGSAASSYGIALVSELYGWHITLITWCVIALLGLILIFVAYKMNVLKKLKITS